MSDTRDEMATIKKELKEVMEKSKMDDSATVEAESGAVEQAEEN